MSDDQDAELTRELEALVASKEREQRLMKDWLVVAIVAAFFVFITHHQIWAVLVEVTLSISALALSVRHHLRAAKLRGEAMERILKEAFRREGQQGPKADA